MARASRSCRTFAARWDEMVSGIPKHYLYDNTLASMLINQHRVSYIEFNGGYMEIRNSSVLITGGSRGLGRALGRALADAGARIALVARDRESLAGSVAEIRGRGAVAFAIPADVANKSDIYSIAGQAAALIGPI